jgi:hypothetical protein
MLPDIRSKHSKTCAPDAADVLSRRIESLGESNRRSSVHVAAFRRPLTLQDSMREYRVCSFIERAKRDTHKFDGLQIAL